MTAGDVTPPAGGRSLVRVLELEDVRLTARAGSAEPVIEGRIVPFGQPAMVRDMDLASMRHVGPRYREVIVGLETPGGGFDPSRIVLEHGAAGDGRLHRGAIAGRGFDGRREADGAYVAFRMLRTQAGMDLHALAAEGLISKLSIEMEPESPTRRRPDGTVERTAIVGRVSAVERGAYAGAEITAVRADDQEGTNVPDQDPAAAAATTTDAPPAPATAPAAPAQARAGEAGELVARQAAEAAAVATLARSAAPIMVTRDELVYGPSSEHRFLADLVRGKIDGDDDARARLARHYRMLDDIGERIAAARTFDALDSVVMGRAGDVLSTEIPGAYPSTYLPGLLTPRILKGRPMGGFYERVPITDARPQIFAKVTTSTSVAAQAAEGTNPAASDFATTAVTANPLLYGAETVVSRQVIDGASPAAEAMVIADMLEAYAQASETVIKTAIEAGSTDSGVAITAATPFGGVQANVINYYGVRFQGASGAFAPTAGFTTLLSENDTTGRPKLPWIGAVNSDGVVQDGAQSGAMLSASIKLSYASTVNVWVFGRPSDFVIFESPISRFSADQVTGPAGVRIGIWAYLVVGARLGSLKKTAA